MGIPADSFSDCHKIQVFVDYRTLASLALVMESKGVKFPRQYSHLIRLAVEAVVDSLVPEDERIESVVDGIQSLETLGFPITARPRARLAALLGRKQQHGAGAPAPLNRSAVRSLADEMREALERG